MFNIKGNDYKPIAKFHYEKQWIFIRFIGTHKEYDNINAEAIKIRMEEMHLKQVDLVSEIGGKSRFSEILNKKRKLTIDMIRRFTKRLNLSAGLLIHDYHLNL